MIRFGIAANARPMPLPSSAGGDVDLPALAAREGKHGERREAQGPPPASSSGFEPKSFSSRPVCEPKTSIATVVGTRNSPACVTDAPKP